MPDYITPAECESFPGCKTSSFSLFTDYHIPASSEDNSEVSIRLYDEEGCSPDMWVNDKPCLVEPTIANVRRLLSALSGEMSDAEMALEVMRVIGDVLICCDENDFWSVWERDRTGINMICGDYNPLTAARAAAARLGVDLPSHLKGGE